MPQIDIPTKAGIQGPPAEIKSKIAALGKNFNEDIITEVTRLYIPLLRKIPPSGGDVIKDVAYGAHERHRLDIHLPKDISRGNTPSIAFFHGGGFVGGNKNTVSDLIYGNVGNFFAKNGIIGVNATYRLAPRHKWPEGARDVGAVAQWLREHIASYGGDSEKIFLFGHSAGAAHVATYVFHQRLHNENGVGAAGAVLMSGIYEPLTRSPKRYERHYYGEDETVYPERSVFNHIDGLTIPVFIIMAEHDLHFLEMQSVRLLEALCERDQHCPRFTRIRNHNHISEILHLNTDDDSIGSELLDFVKAVLQQQ